MSKRIVQILVRAMRVLYIWKSYRTLRDIYHSQVLKGLLYQAKKSELHPKASEELLSV